MHSLRQSTVLIEIDSISLLLLARLQMGGHGCNQMRTRCSIASFVVALHVLGLHTAGLPGPCIAKETPFTAKGESLNSKGSDLKLV